MAMGYHAIILEKPVEYTYTEPQHVFPFLYVAYHVLTLTTLLAKRWRKQVPLNHQ